MPVGFFPVLLLLSLSLLLLLFRNTMGVGPVKTFSADAQRVVLRQVDVSASGPRETAHFAAGCFWSVEMAFQRIPGVVSTEVGYTQGMKKNPTYEEVCTGSTGHTEAVKVVYDTMAVTYDDLLTVFWDIHDPTTKNRQGGDVGTQYRSGVYYLNEAQRVAALSSRDRAQKKFVAPIVTEIAPAAEWYAAEQYHQQYLQKGGQCARKGSLEPIRCYG